MHQREFWVRALAVVLGVNTLAWSVSVGISPHGGTVSAPITPQGIATQSLSANTLGAVATTSAQMSNSQFVAQ